MNIKTCWRCTKKFRKNSRIFLCNICLHLYHLYCARSNLYCNDCNDAKHRLVEIPLNNLSKDEIMTYVKKNDIISPKESENKVSKNKLYL